MITFKDGIYESMITLKWSEMKVTIVTVEIIIYIYIIY